MADVSKIRLPDNTELSIKDSRILGIDSTPTANSDNLVTSGGVKSYVDNHSVTVDSMTNAEIDTAVNSAWV